MRSTADILARIEAVKDADFFGAETSDLIAALPFEAARPFLKPDVTTEQWEPTDTDEKVRASIVEYLPFALDKATDHRGLSASRSIAHMRTRCWLIGDDESLAVIEDDQNYRPYGMPILKHLCAKYGVDFPTDEAAQRMGSGDECVPCCTEGCNV